MNNGKEFKFFNLVKACKDCPFKKGNTYLSGEGIMMRIEHVRDQDLTFRCHKTVEYGAQEEFLEIQEYIEEEIASMPLTCTREDVQAKRIELAKEHGLEKALAEYQASEQSEMMCAGMMILAKKEGFAFNNRAIRFAAMSGILDMDQYKDEHEVYDSIQEAVEAHEKGL
jgi:hypothetical protein